METKFNHKIFLILLKTIPIILAAVYFVNSLLRILGINLWIFNLFGSVSIMSLMFLYLASYAFQFCSYHRMFLHYISVITIYNILDLCFVFNVSNNNLFILLMIITFIFMIITLYKYLKNKKGGSYGNNT